MDTWQKGDKVEINTNDGRPCSFPCKVVFIDPISIYGKPCTFWNNMNVLISEFVEEMNHYEIYLFIPQTAI